LREAARSALTARLRKNGITPASVEASSLQPASFRELWEQSSLFEPSQVYVVKRAEQCKTLSKLLDDISKQTRMACSLLIFAASDKLLVALSKSLARLDAAILPCFEPWPSDMPPFIQRIAAKKSLHLTPDAVRALVEACGTDLSRLDNELNKLALLELGDQPLDANLVRPFLGLIREDHVFKLDQFLAEGNWSQAHALCTDLLARGEKGLQ